jgi:type VI protein secretion system component VasF
MFAHLKENTPISPFVVERTLRQLKGSSINRERSNSSTLWWLLGTVFSLLLVATFYFWHRWQNKVTTKVLLRERKKAIGEAEMIG